eukprot:6200316-Pleurochrysis_carterae.AAC.1
MRTSDWWSGAKRSLAALARPMSGSELSMTCARNKRRAAQRRGASIRASTKLAALLGHRSMPGAVSEVVTGAWLARSQK